MALRPLTLSPKSYQAYVIYVLSTDEFWIQLVDFERDLEALMFDLNCSLLPPLADGSISPKVPYAAVYSEDGRVYRALVTAKQQEKNTYMVRFVDYGNSECKLADELLLLPDRFANLPCQAVPCHLPGVSSSGTSELQALVLDELATVTVLAQPVQGSYAVDISTKRVQSVLSHLRSKYPQRGGGSAREGGGSGPPQQGSLGYSDPKLPVAGSPTSAVVCFSHGPARFWVHLEDCMQDLVRLQAAIDEHMQGGAAGATRWGSRAPAPGMPCLAQSNLDWRWYRARVTELGSNGQHQVCFVDYGSSEAVPLSQICQLPPKLLHMLPSAQALECCLANAVVAERSVAKAHTRFDELTSGGVQLVMTGPSPSSPSGPAPVTVLVAEYGSVAELLAKEGLVTLKSTGQQQQLPGAGAAGEPAATAAGTAAGTAAHSRLGYKTLQLPQPGTKVAAIGVHVVSPGRFWCHLRLYEESMQFVQGELQRQCNASDGGQPPLVFNPRPGLPCCSRFSSDGLWYRARIQEQLDADCLVEYVDYGNGERVSASGLVQLPLNLLAVAPQAVPCTLAVTASAGAGRRGAGRQDSWTPSECQEFERLVLFQSLQLLVSDVTSDGVLVVDVLTQAGPVSELMQQSASPSGVGAAAAAAAPTRSRADDGMSPVVGRQAPYGSAATTGSQPLPGSGGRLAMAATGAAGLGRESRAAAAGKNQPLTVVVDGGELAAASAAVAVPATGTFERVRIVWIVSPYQFYCHRDSAEKQLLQIAEGVAKAVGARRPLRRPAQGAVCVALYDADGQWYRAMIKAALPASAWSVHFLDYGNTATVANSADLLETDPALAEVPPQAVTCKLRGIVPSSVRGEWTDDVRDKMELVVGSREGLRASFVACHRDVNLVDLYLDDGTSVAEELIATGIAKPVRADMPLGIQTPPPTTSAATVTGSGPKASAGNPVTSVSPWRPNQHGGGSGSSNMAPQHGRRDGGFVPPPPSRREPPAAAAASPSAWPNAAASGGLQQTPRQGGGSFQQTPRQGGGGFQQTPRQGGGGFQQPARPDSGGLGLSGGWPSGGSGNVAATAAFSSTAYAQRDFDADGSSRPGRFHRKPVDRAGQQPRRPRDSDSGDVEQQQQQPRSFVDGNGRERSREPLGAGRAGAGEENWSSEPPRAAKAAGSKVAASAPLPEAESEVFKGIDLAAGTPYPAYVSYMPPEQSLDGPDARLKLCVQLQCDETLVEAVQDGVRRHVDAEPGAGACRPSGVGAPCLAMYSADGAWYRAEIVALDAASNSASVLFVDYGNLAVVPADRLRDLPSNLLRLAPRLAISCLVDDVASLTGGLPESTLDALREKLDCHAMAVTFAEAVTGYCGESLLPCRVAVLEPLSTDEAACDATAAAAAAVETLCLEDAEVKDGEEQERKGHAFSDSDDLTIIVGYSPAELEPGREYEAAITAYGCGTNDFWLQLRRDEHALAGLAAEIELFVAESGADEAAYVCTPPIVGSTCLARYSSDGQWYRAEVAVVHPDTDTAELLYIDFGNTDIVQWPSRSILQLPAKIGQLPCYAVRCTLSADSPASLQDHEASPGDYLVAIFSTVPADHHEAATCRLLPPKQQPESAEQQQPAPDAAETRDDDASEDGTQAAAAQELTTAAAAAEALEGVAEHRPQIADDTEAGDEATAASSS